MFVKMGLTNKSELTVPSQRRIFVHSQNHRFDPINPPVCVLTLCLTFPAFPPEAAAQHGSQLRGSKPECISPLPSQPVKPQASLGAKYDDMCVFTRRTRAVCSFKSTQAQTAQKTTTLHLENQKLL